MNPLKRILLVQGGTWGDASLEENRSYLQTIATGLGSATRRDPKTGVMVPVAEVEVVKKEDLDACMSARGADTVVLNSRSEIKFARDLKSRHRSVQVVVLTGLIPDDEIVILSKGGPVRDVLLGL